MRPQSSGRCGEGCDAPSPCPAWRPPSGSRQAPLVAWAVRCFPHRILPASSGFGRGAKCGPGGPESAPPDRQSRPINADARFDIAFRGFSREPGTRRVARAAAPRLQQPPARCRDRLGGWKTRRSEFWSGGISLAMNWGARIRSGHGRPILPSARTPKGSPCPLLLRARHRPHTGRAPDPDLAWERGSLVWIHLAAPPSGASDRSRHPLGRLKTRTGPE